MRPTLHAEVARLRAAYGASSVVEWPTCLRCTDATYARHPDLGYAWVPVESYRVEPDVFRHIPIIMPNGRQGSHVEADVLYPPRQRGTRGWFRVVAECHGYEAVAEVDVPYWWGTAHVKAAIQNLLFFGQDKSPDHGLVTRIH